MIKVLGISLLAFIYIFIFENSINNFLIEYFNLSQIKVRYLKNFFKYSIKTNTILIFEPSLYHYECTPGYTKYFIELGFNVDIIMHEMGISTFDLFNSSESESIRLFIYKDRAEAIKYGQILELLSDKYYYLLIETTEPLREKIYIKQEFLNKNNSIFVFHHLDYIGKMNFSQYNFQNRIWSIGNFSTGLQVNPHYFGKLRSRDKNKITRFLITSSRHRSYEFIVSASRKLKQENLDFQIIVVGKFITFSEKNITEELKSNFIFRYNISYIDLYKTVESVDFIIINLDPKNKKDGEFLKTRVTGSAQLVYGFCKPALINKNFSKIYSMTEDNSLIYDQNNFFQIMHKAISLNNNDYQKLKKGLFELSNYIYFNSMNNVKKTLKFF